MTLIFPFAHYFHASVDSLLGYDESLIEREILDVIDKEKKLYEEMKYEEAFDLFKGGCEKYPNDFRIMNCYLFYISGGYSLMTQKYYKKMLYR